MIMVKKRIIIEDPNLFDPNSELEPYIIENHVPKNIRDKIKSIGFVTLLDLKSVELAELNTEIQKPKYKLLDIDKAHLAQAIKISQERIVDTEDFVDDK